MQLDHMALTAARRNRRGLQAMLLLALVGGNASAQSPEELKAAADKWMSRPTLRMNFADGTSGWRSTFEVDRASGMINFGGGRGYCFGQNAPTKVTFNGRELTVALELRKGCNGVEYRFNPVTGAGEVFSAPPGTDQWAKAPATISLRE